MSIPAWFAKLPASRGKKLLAIDNNVISEYFIRKQETPELKFVFEDPGLQIQCSRQVIDEALNHPGLPAVQRPNVWASLTKLQQTGKLFLSGTTQMMPAQLADYKELIRLLQQASVSQEDAAVAADAIVKKIPLLSLDQKSQKRHDRRVAKPRRSDVPQKPFTTRFRGINLCELRQRTRGRKKCDTGPLLTQDCIDPREHQLQI
jgi:hypothetical protein